jgi:hypothetical protein
VKEGCDWEKLAPEPQTQLPVPVPVQPEEPTQVGAKL